jgi:hypothetical protein
MPHWHNRPEREDGRETANRAERIAQRQCIRDGETGANCVESRSSSVAGRKPECKGVPQQAGAEGLLWGTCAI